MILKRYVLTKNKNIIDVVKNGGLQYYGSTFSRNSGSVWVQNICYGDDYPDETIVTSDNLLDLVEANDLIDLEGKIVQVADIDNESKRITLFNLEVINKDKKDKHITAIYKRQDNGNYIRHTIVV